MTSLLINSERLNKTILTLVYAFIELVVHAKIPDRRSWPLSTTERRTELDTLRSCRPILDINTFTGNLTVDFTRNLFNYILIFSLSVKHPTLRIDCMWLIYLLWCSGGIVENKLDLESLQIPKVSGLFYLLFLFPEKCVEIKSFKTGGGGRAV